MKKIIILSLLIIGTFIGGAAVSSAATLVNIDYSVYENTITELEQEISEIDTLLAECRLEQIPTPYENMRYNVMVRFLGYLKDELTNGIAYRTVENGYTDVIVKNIYDYNISCLESIYNECKTNLTAFLNGSKNPIESPMVLTGNTVIDASTVIADTQMNDVKEVSKVFLSGYLGDDAIDEVGELQNFGANIIQMGVGISQCFYRASGIENWIRRYNMNLGCPDANYKRVSDEKHSGSYSIKFFNNSEHKDNFWLGLNQRVKLKPDTDYTLSVWLKGEEVSYFTMKPYSSRAVKNMFSGEPVDIANWTQYSVKFNSGSDTNANVYISTGGPTKMLYVDDVTLCETGSNINLLKNGDFETDVSEDRYIDLSPAELDEVLAPLKEAADGNVKVDLLFNLDYFINELYNEHEGLKSTASSTGIGYNVSHPVARDVMRYFITKVMTEAVKYESLNSVCMVNEPWIGANIDYYKNDWTEHLKGIYGEITTLNSYYGTKYASFADVPFPTTVNRYDVWGYDYKQFIEKIMTEWIEFLHDCVKDVAPDVPVHVKAMQYLVWADEPIARWRVGDGYNHEKIIDYVDINGNDAELKLSPDAGETYAEFMEKKALQKSMWYDFMLSLKKAPVFNSEDHIIANGDVEYSFAHRKNITAEQWMSGIHGRNMSTVWLWDRSQKANEDYKWESLLFRPDIVETLGKTSIDLNRLANEVDTIVDTSPKVGIFYSDTSRVYQREHMNTVYKAYEGCVFNGLKAGFVVESQIEKLNDYDLIIIPNANYVPKNVLDAFVAYDGELIIFGNNSLKFSERRKAHIESVVNSVHSKALSVLPVTIGPASYLISAPTTDTIFRTVKEEASKLNLMPVEIIDNTTGKAVKNVEFLYSEVNCGKIISICNYDWDNDKNISIYINGIKVTNGMTELKSGEKLSENITLKSFEPMLVRVEEGA